MVEKAPGAKQTTSTGSQVSDRPINLQISFGIFVGALEVVLIALWRVWGFDSNYAGFEVAVGATIPVALLLIVALANYLAEEFKWDYLWVIPNFERVRKPDIFVGIGFVVGFIAGLFLWT